MEGELGCENVRTQCACNEKWGTCRPRISVFVLPRILAYAFMESHPCKERKDGIRRSGCS
jgi:hypothetical protein